MIFDFICGIRAGINPAPMVAECCNHFDNSLITKVLYTSAVGVGFIPTLATADKIQSKCTAAAREGMKPSPTLDVCCIVALSRCSPTNSGEDTKQIPRSSEGGEK